jgi:hypothetical protein
MLRDKVLVTGAEDPLPCGFSSLTKMRSPGAKVGATWTNLLAPRRTDTDRRRTIVPAHGLIRNHPIYLR